MKKLNKPPILSNNEILNKYIITYTDPLEYITEFHKFFIDVIDDTNDKKLIKYILEEYYDYDKMIHHENPIVRIIYAKNGYNHKNYINDEVSLVRIAVARKGKYLDILSNDKNLYVRNVAKKKLKELENEKIK
jgi:hypothetical protein